MHIGKKGFTLVEIIVSLAIMTIVAGAVGAFVIAGNNSYMRGNKELTLQEEAQLTANQLIDLIIDVERGIDFRTTTGQAVDVEGNTVAENVPVAELLLRNNDNVYMVRWQGQNAGEEYASANQLYLYEAANTKDADGKITEWGDPSDPSQATPSLMAEYVTAFNIDLTDLEKHKVKLEMTFVYQDKSYNVSETIKLRNTLSDEESDGYVWIDGLTIAPNPADVARGQSQTFDYKFSGDSAAVKAAAAQGVTWSVSKADGSTCNSKIDSDGKLTVAQDEDLGNGVLIVTCTSRADTSKVATAKVNVTEKVSLTISPENATVQQNGKLQFSYTLDASSEEVKNGGVKWSVEKADGTSKNRTTITPDGGLLKVGENETTGSAVLIVTCESVKRPDVKATAIVSVEKRSNINDKYDCTLIANTLTLYDFVDGSTQKKGYKATIECLPSWADYLNGYPKTTWSVPYDYNHSYKITGLIDEDGRQFEAELECGNNIDTKVYVEAEIQLSADVTVTRYIWITIPDLETVKKDSKSPYITADIDESDKTTLNENGFVLSRAGRIVCKIMNYTDDKGNPKEVLWRFEDLPAELEHNYTLWNGQIVDSYKVGFGVVTGPWDGQDQVKYLETEAIGTSTDVRALKNIDITGEYHLKLVAYSVEDGTKVAETVILVPAVQLLFNEREHVIKVHVPCWSSYEQFIIDTYGFENESNKRSDATNYTFEYDAVLQADEAKAPSTLMGTTSSQGNHGSWTSFQIAAEEENDYLVLVVYTYKNGTDKGNDQETVRQAVERLKVERADKINELQNAVNNSTGDAQKEATKSLKAYMDAIDSDAEKERTNYLFKRNYLLVIQRDNK